MGNFKFGEHSTKDFDLVIQAPPTYNFPEKDVTVEHVPGRNGDLVIDNDCWKNIERTYSVASIFRPGTDFISNSQRLIEWLSSVKGYQRLEDSYDSEVYRMAIFRQSGSLTNYYDVATAINVSFECKPQRYLKNGEKTIDFVSSVAILENPTGYTALPEITIKNVFPSDNEILLCTIQNEGKVTSVISFNKVYSAQEPYDIVLNSELQTVYSPQQGDINAYINLNDLDFPKLGNGISRISINSYTENEGEIAQYNNLINQIVVGDNVCLAKYMPYDSIIESKQDSIYIMSFDLLKQKYEEVYEMKAYANYCLEVAEEYIFESFNSILALYSQTFSFQGDYGSKPEWLNITKNADGTLNIYAGDLYNLTGYKKHYGYFITKNASSASDKRIYQIASGGSICENAKKSSTITVIFYPAYTDENFSTSKEYSRGDETVYDNKVYKFIEAKSVGAWDPTKVREIENVAPGDLAVNYDEQNIPDWLSFKIDYETVSNKKSPNKITFLKNKTGFYYYKQEALFNPKYIWKKFDTNVPGMDNELNSLKWEEYKKAFVTGLLSTSTTVSFEYYFLPYPYHGVIGDEDYEEYPQYKPVYTNELNDDGSIKRDANGNPIPKIENDVHFIVKALSDGDSDIGSIQLYAKENGYFRFNDSDQYNGWFAGTQGDLLNGPGVSTSIKSSNIIYFSKNIPTYKDIDSWPEWLNSTQELDNGMISSTYGFIVRKSAWYQYTYIDSQTKNEVKSLWTFIYAGNRLGEKKEEVFTPYNIPHGESVSVYKIDGIEATFPVKKYSYADPDDPTIIIENIGFFHVDNEGKEIENDNNLPPDWLKVSIEKGEKADYSDWLLNFYPNSNGLFKWDTKSVWKYMQASTEEDKKLVSSTGTDDTSVYFMSSLPEYPTSGTITEPIYDYCRVEVNENAETGNPESISIYAKVSGYYRFKNSSIWKYFNVDDKICDSKISETSEIYYLTESDDELDDIEISVIPRWWSL